jgi:hypothetical protein
MLLGGKVFTLTHCGFYLIVAFGLSSVPELKQKAMLLFSNILTVSERCTQVLNQKPNIVRRKISIALSSMISL